MSISELSLLVQSSIALAVLSFLWFRLWPQAQTDIFRQEMFAVRDELFLYAASGKISFSHPAYRLLRKSMNGYLRYGHRLGPFKIGLTLLEWKMTDATPDLSWIRSWEGALANIPDQQIRLDLIKFHSRATRLTLNNIISRSFLLRLGILGAGSGILLHGRLQSFRSAMRKTARLIERLIEEDAARTAA